MPGATPSLSLSVRFFIRVRFPRKDGKTGYQQLNHLGLAKYFSCIFGLHFTYESAILTAYTICNVNYIPLLMK